jgi:hypothetical protein
VEYTLIKSTFKFIFLKANHLITKYLQRR